MRSLPYEQHKQ